MPAQGLSIAASKLVSLGLAAKIGIGVTVVTASVAAAGAAGVLPDQANERARDAIETLTPVNLDDPADNHGDDVGDPAANHGENFGSVVSSDATGESDGEPGVDGSEISSLAPGAAHRPAEPGQAAQAGPPESTGQDPATETPAAPHIPDNAGAPQAPPSTTPDRAAGPPETPPSTVPEGSNRPG